METPLQIRRAVESEIRMAFHGVTLGRGASLRQAQFADGLRDAAWNAHSASPAHGEIIGDWSRVPLDELESDCMAHLDALGFRYYIPALMLSVLNHYESSSMRAIGTITGLYPKKDNSWEYHMHRYSLPQPCAEDSHRTISCGAPKLVVLDFENQKIVLRALRNAKSH
jgi:hypothetical protein